MQINITVKGDKEVNKRLRRLGSSLLDFRVAMGTVGEEAAKYYSGKAWSSEGAAFGNPWASLKRSTINAKLRKNRSTALSPLVGSTSGGMRDSFTHLNTRSSVVITNKKDYFKYHQSTMPRKRLPRRQMMGINDPLRRMVERVIKQDIENKIRSA